MEEKSKKGLVLELYWSCMCAIGTCGQHDTTGIHFLHPSQRARDVRRLVVASSLRQPVEVGLLDLVMTGWHGKHKGGEDSLRANRQRYRLHHELVQRRILYERNRETGDV